MIPASEMEKLKSEGLSDAFLVTWLLKRILAQGSFHSSGFLSIMFLSSYFNTNSEKTPKGEELCPSYSRLFWHLANLRDIKGMRCDSLGRDLLCVLGEKSFGGTSQD